VAKAIVKVKSVVKPRQLVNGVWTVVVLKRPKLREIRPEVKP
jgi:hypothetical protein